MEAVGFLAKLRESRALDVAEVRVVKVNHEDVHGFVSRVVVSGVGERCVHNGWDGWGPVCGGGGGDEREECEEGSDVRSETMSLFVLWLTPFAQRTSFYAVNRYSTTGGRAKKREMKRKDEVEHVTVSRKTTIRCLARCLG